MTTNDEAATTIARLSRVFETRLGERSMTLPQYRVLAFLSQGEWAASAVADWLAVSRPSVTALVDGLVERGWVTREHCSTDRRRVLHHLTDDGRAVLGDAGSMLAGVLDGLLGHLDADERRRAEDGLDLLTVALQRHRATRSDRVTDRAGDDAPRAGAR